MASTASPSPAVPSPSPIENEAAANWKGAAVAEPEKAVVITGASTGIGRATSLHLARSGFRVFAGVRKKRDADLLEAVGGGKLVPIEIDVTDAASIGAAAARVREVLGRRGLDGLVNNAGIGNVAPVQAVSMDLLRRSFEVDVFGQIAVIQAFLPLILEGRGRIVNMGSVGGHITMPFGGVLCACKSAFGSLSDALRLELHPFGVRVCLIEPGAIATPGVDKTLGDVDGAIASFAPEIAARYGPMYREFSRRSYERESHGSPPEVVARAVYRALTARRPRARYPVGKHARLLGMLARALPDRPLDDIRRRLFGLPRDFGVLAAGPGEGPPDGGRA